MADNITQIITGINTDLDPVLQPQGSIRFALNFSGNYNEESNHEFGNLPENSKVIGTCYVGDDNNVIFSVRQGDGYTTDTLSTQQVTISEIGLLKSDGIYEVIMNDQFSFTNRKLNFNSDYLIQATYRRRRGKERIVYFTDNLNRPRCFNIDRPEKYRIDTGMGSFQYDADKFELFRSYDQIPVFQKLKVNDYGGSLLPGSYNIAIQYVDEDFNSTEWITSSGIIKVYHHISTDYYANKAGTINSEIPGLQFGPTTKSITVSLSNLDKSYPYYRLAFLEANKGSGFVVDVKVTEIIPCIANEFTYTGLNFRTTTTIDEIRMFKEFVEKSETICQIDNRLLLGNVTNREYDYIKFQEAANQIWSFCILREVQLNKTADKNSTISQVIAENSKDPLLDIEGKGYMPGEIYSFGISYIFKNGNRSPVFHIPGMDLLTPHKYDNLGNKGTGKQVVINNTNRGLFYMSTDNKSETRYIPNRGFPIDPLTEHSVNRLPDRIRHHRFPNRSELELVDDNAQVLFYKETKTSGSETEMSGKFTAILAFDPDLRVNNEPDRDLVDNDNSLKRIENWGDIGVPYAILVFHDTNKEITLDATMMQMASDGFPAHNDNRQFMRSNWFSNANDPNDRGKYVFHNFGQAITNQPDYINPSIYLDRDATGVYAVRAILLQNDSFFHGDLDLTSAEIAAVGNRDFRISVIFKVEQSKIIHFENGVWGSEGNNPGSRFHDANTNSGDAAIYFSYVVYNLKNSNSKIFNLNTFYDNLSLEFKYQTLTDLFACNYYFSARRQNAADRGLFGKRDKNQNIIFALNEFEIYGSFKIIAKVFGLREDINQYYSMMFGIKFDNITIPEGYSDQIIGYEIVRQERTQDEKTILTSGVCFPTKKNGDNIISSYLLFNKDEQDSENNFVLQTPEYLFKDERLPNPSHVQVEGYYRPLASGLNYGGFTYQDVFDGSSKKDIDNDGWSFVGMSKDIQMDFIPLKNIGLVEIDNAIEKFSYLKAVDKTYLPKTNSTFYNLSSDNRVILISLAQTNDSSSGGFKSVLRQDADGDFKKVSYVKFIRKLVNNYTNFYTTPYYKECPNIQLFDNNLPSSVVIFHGDIYLHPIKYTNSYLQEYKLNTSSRDTSIWDYVVGAISALAGTAIAIFTPATNVGLSLIGSGVGMIKSGYDSERAAEIYGKDYKNFLGDAISHTAENNNPSTNKSNEFFSSSNNDDEIRYVLESFSNFWFETDINISLRNGYISQAPAYINSPTTVLDDAAATTLDITLKPISFLDKYFASKFLVSDSKRNEGKAFIGTAISEYYNINPDYEIKDDAKVYFHLPIEYDLGSNYKEQFPHRVMYSQQSFQEELSDNNRVFFSNDYRDIPGISGSITNLIDYKNNLLVHTQEALWVMPRSYQERITDQIVSFIGTGSFFEVPPNKVIDSATGLSAGSSHKFATIKTPVGLCFISEREQKIYVFTEGLNSISDRGNQKWFRDNLKLNTPNLNGFIGVYDSQFNRVIFTKRDKIDINGTSYDKSWTIGFLINPVGHFTPQFPLISFYSYLPDMYLNTSTGFISYKQSTDKFWKHRTYGQYQKFYDQKYPYILEFVDNAGAATTKVWDDLTLQLRIEKYDHTSGQFFDVDDKFFDEFIAYNSIQSTGLNRFNLINPTNNFLQNQVTNTPINNLPSVNIRKIERNWNINNIRDYRHDYKSPIFTAKTELIQNQYFIDKVLTDTFNYNKHWSELQQLRDKYIIYRLINNDRNNDNLRFTFFFSQNKEQPSIR